MPGLDRDLLARRMAAMAADRAQVVPFLDDFGADLRRLVRWHLSELCRPDLARDAEEVEGLVIDVAFVLAERAASWDPAGAPPWVWAQRAVRAEIVRVIGHASTELDADRLELDAARRRHPAGAAQTDPGDVLEAAPVADDLWSLAHRLGDPQLTLLVSAIGEAVANARQQAVYVEFRLQKLQGDPSPAETVAPRMGLTAANVRQIASRSHRRVLALVQSDERYRPLLDLGWFAA